MSKVADLLIEIEDRLRDGWSFWDIARALDIPVSWVVEAAESYGFDNGHYEGEF